MQCHAMHSLNHVTDLTSSEADRVFMDANQKGGNTLYFCPCLISGSTLWALTAECAWTLSRQLHSGQNFLKYDQPFVKI